MTRRRARRRGRGFTLIELMIALTISALLVGMVMSIFIRMSTAYRSQQYVADLQRKLTAAQDLLQRDIRQAGFGMLDGVRFSGPPVVHPAIEIRDNASTFGPDELHVYYGDTSAQARVMQWNSTTAFLVDNQDNFAAGDVVLVTKRSMDSVGSPPVAVARYRSCVGQIASITANIVSLRIDGTWGEANNAQCNEVHGGVFNLAVSQMMVYRFIARGYRIDATRQALGVLQLSPTAGLVDDWADLGVGFTDLQLASRWYETEDGSPGRKTVDTDDLDTDPARDWYSGAEQTTLTTGNSTFLNARPLITELRLTLVVRTTQRLDAVGASATPNLTDAARPDNNDVGNRAAVTLAGVADGSRPVELRGDAIYRYSTVGSDLRNLAVAR